MHVGLVYLFVFYVFVCLFSISFLHQMREIIEYERDYPPTTHCAAAQTKSWVAEEKLTEEKLRFCFLHK